MPTYIPAVLENYESFVRNLYDKLTATPTAYGVTAEQIIPFATAYEAFATAFALSEDPVTRTKPTITERNTARRLLNQQIRPLVATIQASPVMTDTKRDQLELPIRDVNPTPVPKPATAPLLTVTNVLGRVITINLREQLPDGNPSERRGKPEGVKGAAIYYGIGDAAPTTSSGWAFAGNVGTTTTRVTIPVTVPAGSKVWLTAQWLNPRLEAGPGCPAVATFVNFGGNELLAA